MTFTASFPITTGDWLIRRLTTADIPRAFELSCEAGWNQTLEEWGMLIELDPEGCFGLECDGRLVATSTLVCYGTRLAWLGMVLTSRDYRHRGFARRLVTRALALADTRHVETVKLDATEQGRGLYETADFKPEKQIERWSGKGRASSRKNTGHLPSQASIEMLDRDAFPADRSHLLRLLSGYGKAFVSRDGYLLQRPGNLASYLGPCVSATSNGARRLIECCLSEGKGAYFWDLFPGNPEAVAIATAFGFQPERTLVRMYRGSEFHESEKTIYAIAGFTFG
jgi:GNAT superfamily N-acetyltransferase